MVDILKGKLISLLLFILFTVNVSGYNDVYINDEQFEQNIIMNEEVSLYIFMIGLIENLTYFKQLSIKGYEFNCKNVWYFTIKPGESISYSNVRDGNTDMIVTYSDSKSDWSYKGYIRQNFICAVQILKQF